MGGKEKLNGSYGCQWVMHGVGFIQALPVDVDLPVDHFQAVARQPNDALYEMLMVRKGIFENDNVAALQLPVREQLFIPGAAFRQTQIC